ncbi:MAG: hypothetical protein AAB778_03545 [Patescibacteria group bacterium]
MAIIPIPAIKTAFKIFPIPKYLKIIKSVIQKEIIKPRLELAKIKEKIKNERVNINMKNIKIFKLLAGSRK